MWLFYYFNFERNYLLKSKSPCTLLNKNINFKKWNRTKNWKFHTVLQRQTLCFSSYKNHKLEVKLWRAGACEKNSIFCIAYFVPRIFFQNLCFIQNIHTFTYQKALLHTLFCLFLESSKAFIQHIHN